jgi:hypothetical protein
VHRINKALGRKGKLWQDEYFDSMVERFESLQQRIDYVRQNPMRAGLVTKADDYKWLWESPLVKEIAPKAFALRERPD